MFSLSKINLSKVFASAPSPTSPDPLPKNNDERLIAVIAHLLPIIGPVVPPHFWIFSILPPLLFWQIKRHQSLFLAAVAMEVLNFQICAAGLLTLAAILSHIPHIGVIFAAVIPLGLIAMIAFMTAAAMECKQGKFFRYPWIQRWVK